MERHKQRILSRARGEISITREISYIIGRAQKQDSRLVRFGSLIIFSTQTGDAWILDPEDHLALCLALDGTRQEFSVLDTPENFQIEWNAHYTINGDLFVVATPDGSMRSISGYPTEAIQKQ